MIFLLPIQLVAVYQDAWFWAPPKPAGSGLDNEVIGFELSRGQGWATHFSDPAWRELYLSFDATGYQPQLDGRVPNIAFTSRPPLLPTWIATIYTIVPRGPYASAAIRLSLAVAIAIGCSLFATWGWCIASSSTSLWLRQYAFWVAWFTMVVVNLEHDLRSYATDFLVEPFALCSFSAFAILLWQSVHRPSIKLAIWSGIAFGALIHCQSAFVLWMPLLPFFIWFVMKETAVPIRTKWKLIFTFLASLLLVVSPWWMRNVLVLGEMQPVGAKDQLQIQIEGFHWIERVIPAWNPYTGQSLAWQLLAIAGSAGLWMHDRRALVWLAFPLLVNTIICAISNNSTRYSDGQYLLVATCGCFYLLVALGCLFLLSEVLRICSPKMTGLQRDLR